MKNLLWKQGGCLPKPGSPADEGPSAREEILLKLPTFTHWMPAKLWHGLILRANTHVEKKLPPGKSYMLLLMERRAIMSMGCRSWASSGRTKNVNNTVSATFTTAGEFLGAILKIQLFVSRSVVSKSIFIKSATCQLPKGVAQIVSSFTVRGEGKVCDFNILW